MNTIIWFLTSIVLTILIFDKFGLFKKFKNERKKSNKIITKLKQEIQLIEEELKRRKNSK